MPSSSTNLDALLRSRPQRVVPAAFLFDESNFAKSAEEQLSRICDADLQKVVRVGTAKDVDQVLRRFFATGFHQSVSPLILMQHIPGWCVWFLSDATSSVETFIELLASQVQGRPGQFHHLLFLNVTQPDKVKPWIDKATASNCLPFLLCAKGWMGMERNDHDLTRAAVAYAYSGWRKYWESGDANLATALVLPQGSRVLTLGMGASELPSNYHAQRWSKKVLATLHEQFLAKTQNTDPPVRKGIKDFLAFMLPDWYVAYEKDRLERSVSVHMDGESTNLYYLERKRNRLGVRWNHRLHFLPLLVRLKDKFCFLNFVTLPNTKRFIERKAEALKEEIRPAICNYLQLPDKANSLVHVLTQRIQYCADYAEAIRETHIAGNAPASSFQKDYENARTRISAIPNLLGAFLRLVLIGIGLAGLLLAPLWWGALQHPLADDLMRYVSIGSALLLIVSIVGVFVHYYYACWVADHHIELAESNLELRHLRKIAALAIEEVRKEGNALQKIVDEQRETLYSLEDGIRKAAVESRKAAEECKTTDKSPTGSWLSNSSVDILMQRRLAELCHQAYLRIVSELNMAKSESGLVRLDTTLWQRCLAKQVAAVSTEAIELLTFDQCVAEMKPSPGEQEALISNLAHESSKPAWEVRPDAAASVLCFADADQWRAHTGRNDTLQFYKLHLKDMLMVSVIPLRQFEL